MGARAKSTKVLRNHPQLIRSVLSDFLLYLVDYCAHKHTVYCLVLSCASQRRVSCSRGAETGCIFCSCSLGFEPLLSFRTLKYLFVIILWADARAMRRLCCPMPLRTQPRCVFSCSDLWQGERSSQRQSRAHSPRRAAAKEGCKGGQCRCLEPS